MVDTFSKEIRRKTMQAVKSKNTKLEQRIFTELWGKGIRFGRNVSNLRGKPDIALRKYKIVVFIDSCFWHGCPYHCRMPKSNKAYWSEKIRRNKKRDKEVNSWYKNNEWHVLRFWEHTLKKNAQGCFKKIIKTIKDEKHEKNITLKQLKKEVAKFVKERDWGQYHSPKNLSMSIAIEAAELMEKFQWLSIEESKKATNKLKVKKAVEDELADIAIYLIDFCDVLNIDISKIIMEKVKKNSRKYPIRLAKGKALKYSDYRTR